MLVLTDATHNATPHNIARRVMHARTRSLTRGRVLFPQGQHARGGRSTAPKESSAEAKFRLSGSRLGPAEAQSNAWAPRPALSIVAASA
ncbi:hypothetical protein SAMN05444159_0032 [Bradyrhizobium lablabi]|uniref:Uncharacterized protein n=1 Tax=Bradyrhizobium lablabi TaxID=722472 RepID=A0A1M6HKM1_9BRAD|nr:hypothetical protein SAMN05444159_0032 [Bradyrhizobium lablabi]